MAVFVGSFRCATWGWRAEEIPIRCIGLYTRHDGTSVIVKGRLDGDPVPMVFS